MRIPSILMRKSFERVGVAPEVFKVCAALFQQRTARRIISGWPVESACRVVGRPVQARRATVQARHANTNRQCKHSPRRVARVSRRIARPLTVPNSANRPEICCFDAEGGVELCFKF